MAAERDAAVDTAAELGERCGAMEDVLAALHAEQHAGDAAEAREQLQAQLDELWPDARERAELDRCVASFLTAWDILRTGAVVSFGADTVLQLDDETLAVALTAERPELELTKANDQKVEL